MYIMYNLASSLLVESFSFLQVTRTTIKSGLKSKFSLIKSCPAELAALDHLIKSTLTYNERNVVNTLAPSFLIESFPSCR